MNFGVVVRWSLCRTHSWCSRLITKTSYFCSEDWKLAPRMELKKFGKLYWELTLLRSCFISGFLQLQLDWLFEVVPFVFAFYIFPRFRVYAPSYLANFATLLFSFASTSNHDRDFGKTRSQVDNLPWITLLEYFLIIVRQLAAGKICWAFGEDNKNNQAEAARG